MSLLHFNNSKPDNVPLITILLLKELGIKVTKNTVIETLESHPDYPSLYSISESLKKWNIDNLAFKIDKTKLESIPLPFITIKQKKFILVTKIEDYVDYKEDDFTKISKQTKNDFKNEIGDFVLFAEKTFDSGEKYYARNRIMQSFNTWLFPLILTLLSLFIVGDFIATENLSKFFLVAIKFLGTLMSGLLIGIEAGQMNFVNSKFCSFTGKSNCKAVLSSKYSKLFNFISWSEIGFFYFTGSFLWVLILPSTFIIPVISLLNLLALPFIIYSVYYQWRILKQWCPLCLSIQVILICEFIICSYSSKINLKDLSFTYYQIIEISLIFLLPMFVWFIAKKLFISNLYVKNSKRELEKIKYNQEIFDNLLKSQKKVNDISDDKCIAIGNPFAKNILIKVCNPYCGPCSRAHTDIKNLLKEVEDLKVKIIFTATNNNNDIRKYPVQHLLIINQDNKDSIENALDDWYGMLDNNYKRFSLKYPLSDGLNKKCDKIDEMYNWCKKAGIENTPSFFLNNFQLPSIYTINDLKHLL